MLEAVLNNLAHTLEKFPAHLKSGISSDLHIFVTFIAKFTFEQKDWSKPIKLSSNRWLGFGTKLFKNSNSAEGFEKENALNATILNYQLSVPANRGNIHVFYWDCNTLTHLYELCIFFVNIPFLSLSVFRFWFWEKSSPTRLTQVGRVLHGDWHAGTGGSNPPRCSTTGFPISTRRTDTGEQKHLKI